MEKPIITLIGHDPKVRNTLTLLEAKSKNNIRYKLISPYSNVLRCGINNNNPDVIDWIDPSGGPMMKIGYKVNDLELTEITYSKKIKAFVLKFKRV